MSKSYWKLEDEEYESIKIEVCELLEMIDVRCIPVCGLEIATRMGISLISYSGLSEKKRNVALRISEDGFFLENNGHEYIYYNDIDKSYKRVNWTILHEIGHIVLDHTGQGEKEEDEANFFAKYIIAPPILVHQIKPYSAVDICERFDISYEASCYAFEYYLSWKNRYDIIHRLAPYEEKLLALSKRSSSIIH